MSQAPRTSVMSSAGRPMTASQAFFNNNSLPTNLFQIPDGRYTFTVYTLIKQNKHQDVVRVLEHELQTRTPSRSILSLLAYSYYQLNNFELAAQVYASLVKAYPDIAKYKLYYAQALYKCGDYEESAAVCLELGSESGLLDEVAKLQAAIKYQINDMVGCQKVLSQNNKQDYASMINQGCLHFRGTKFDEAVKVWLECLKKHGYHNELSFYLGLAYYMLKDYAPSLKHISDLIEKNIKEYPEFSFGKGADFNGETKFVENSQTLHETFLVEAYNLKAAIEYRLKNVLATQEVLLDMPARQQSDLDAVSLHNTAISFMERESNAGFQKLNFLLQSGTMPPETLANTLLLYLSHDQAEAAADLLAQTQDIAAETIDPFTMEYINARILSHKSPSEAIKIFENLEAGFMSDIRESMKLVQDARELRDDEKIKAAIDSYDENLDRFVPVVMAHGRIFWEEKRYDQLERLLKRYAEVIGDSEAWKMNFAHTVFMQERYAEAIAYLEPLVMTKADNITSLPAVSLANLCVAYIMVNQNQMAEDIMRRIEREEEVAAANHQSNVNPAPLLHLCIVNLVIGTLYCSRGNYEFGVARVISSFAPMDSKLSGETWFFAKSCLASLAEILAKQMLVLKDATFTEILAFLAEVEEKGAAISAKSWSAGESVLLNESIAAEARQLQHLYLKLYDF